MNNEISYDHDFNRKMEKVCRAFANSLDQAAVTALEAGKTKVLKEKLNYNFTANVIEVPTQMATELWAILTRLCVQIVIRVWFTS